MKLLTINTHSLIEVESDKKLRVLADMIADEIPDVVALQEVNQSRRASEINYNPFECDIECLREDNYAINLLNIINKKGAKYFCVWFPVKVGYERYDEGVAVLSRLPIINIDNFLVSLSDDYNCWKTRRIIGIQTVKGWFYSVHMGWWLDNEEPFFKQWEKINSHVKNKKNVWLMGDFNSRDDIRGEGYDLIINSGWYDSYKLAEVKDNGFTVEEKIDGWSDNERQKMRIDYIFSNFKANIKKSEVVFNGTNKSVISDHYGVMIETKE